MNRSHHVHSLLLAALFVLVATLGITTISLSNRVVQLEQNQSATQTTPQDNQSQQTPTTSVHPHDGQITTQPDISHITTGDLDIATPGDDNTTNPSTSSQNTASNAMPPRPDAPNHQPTKWWYPIDNLDAMMIGTDEDIFLVADGTTLYTWKDDFDLVIPTHAGYSTDDEIFYLFDSCGRLIYLHTDGSTEVLADCVTDYQVIESSDLYPSLCEALLLSTDGTLQEWFCRDGKINIRPIAEEVGEITDAAYGCGTVLVADKNKIAHIRLYSTYYGEFENDQIGTFEQLGGNTIDGYIADWKSYQAWSNYPTMKEFLYGWIRPNFGAY